MAVGSPARTRQAFYSPSSTDSARDHQTGRLTSTRGATPQTLRGQAPLVGAGAGWGGGAQDVLQRPGGSRDQLGRRPSNWAGQACPAGRVTGGPRSMDRTSGVALLDLDLGPACSNRAARTGLRTPYRHRTGPGRRTRCSCNGALPPSRSVRHLGVALVGLILPLALGSDIRPLVKHAVYAVGWDGRETV